MNGQGSKRVARQADVKWWRRGRDWTGSKWLIKIQKVSRAIWFIGRKVYEVRTNEVFPSVE